MITSSVTVPCACCDQPYQMQIYYSWYGTGQSDLDTNTVAFGASVGFACGSGNDYVTWISGDNTGIDGLETVHVLVGDAKRDGLWTSSYNINCYAGWYEPATGSGPAFFQTVYRGVAKTKTIYPGVQSICASTHVATVTVYSQPLTDGTYFEIL